MQALRELIAWPSQYAQEGAALGVAWPRGLLLHGPPGCGKTLMVQAVAGAGRPGALFTDQGGLGQEWATARGVQAGLWVNRWTAIGPSLIRSTAGQTGGTLVACLIFRYCHNTPVKKTYSLPPLLHLQRRWAPPCTWWRLLMCSEHTWGRVRGG